jgi:hypothetical protein
MNSVVTAYPDALPEATSTSLSLPESLTFEQWEEIGAELANRARKLNWWIGDWWAAGHHRYGERARLAARGLFGKEFKTLANIASVCRAFEPSRRREHLSWSHHAEASALSPPAADMLLDLAERDRLSKAQVRAAVTTIRGGPSSRISPDEAAVASLFRAYNRLPGQVRVLVAQAFAAVAVSGAEIDPATGNPRAETPADEPVPLRDEAGTETSLDPTPGMEAMPAELEPEDAFDLAAEFEVTPVEPEPETVFDLAEWDIAPAQAGSEAEPAALDLAPEMEAPEAEAEPEPPLDLAPDMEAVPTAAQSYIEYDLTLDMAALQAEAEPDAALDLDLDMAVPPSEALPEATLDLDNAMETQTAASALDLGPEMEEAEEAERDKDKDKKAAAETEPWLLS